MKLCLRVLYFAPPVIAGTRLTQEGHGAVHFCPQNLEHFTHAICPLQGRRLIKQGEMPIATASVLTAIYIVKYGRRPLSFTFSRPGISFLISPSLSISLQANIGCPEVGSAFSELISEENRRGVFRCLFLTRNVEFFGVFVRGTRHSEFSGFSALLGFELKKTCLFGYKNTKT